MKVWIDLDSIPKIEKEFLLKISSKFLIHFYFVSNNIRIEINEYNHEILVEKTKDSADNYIYKNICKFDIVITRDTLFAEKIAKKTTVINHFGQVLDFATAKNKADKSLKNLKLNKILKEKPKKFNHADFENFCNTFLYILQKRIKEEKIYFYLNKENLQI